MYILITEDRYGTEDMQYIPSYREAEMYARDLANEGQMDCKIFELVAKFEASERPSPSVDRGLRAGIDYPASFGG